MTVDMCVHRETRDNDSLLIVNYRAFTNVLLRKTIGTHTWSSKSSQQTCLRDGPIRGADPFPPPRNQGHAPNASPSSPWPPGSSGSTFQLPKPTEPKALACQALPPSRSDVCV